MTLNYEALKLAKNFALKYHDENKDENEIEWEIFPDSQDFDLEGVNFSRDAQWKKEIECDPDNDKLSDMFF